MHSLETYQLTVLSFGAIILGILALIKGGDWTIESAAYIARRTGLSKLFISATIIAFGTSAPELFTSVNANLSGFPGISLGNVVGSNIANVLVVVGISAIIAPVLIDRDRVRVDTVMMIVASAILVGGMFAGLFSPLTGLAMLLLLVGYVFYQYRADSLGANDVGEDGNEVPFESAPKAALTLLLGFGAMLIGSELLVQGAVAGGVAIGVREAVIGMTVVAFGTSLPELSTCVAAARRGHSDMVVGSIVGSNIFNALSIVGITAMVKPLVVDAAFLGQDLIWFVAVALVFAIFLLSYRKISRAVGIIFVLAYVCFLILQYGDLFGGWS